MSHSVVSSRRRQLWKINGESSIWNNYPRKGRADKLSRLFIIESEDISKYTFVCSSFNNNGNKLATIDQRGNIHEFDFKTFKCEIVSRCGISANSICYSPKYDDITVALNNKIINIFECGTYKLNGKIKTGHKYNINQLQYTNINNNDNKLILMSCSLDIIILWDINNNYQQIQCLSHNHSIIFGLLSPSFESIVTCFANDMISFWDWTDYKEKYQLFYSNKQILKEKIGYKDLKLICGDIDNKNGLLIIGGKGRYIYLWIIKQKILLKCIVLPITIKHVIQLQFLQNHPLNIILALGDDGQIVAIDHKTLNIQFYIQRCSQFIKSFSISNNNKKISCVLSDGRIEIISIKSLCKQYKIYKYSIKPKSEINCIMIQPSKLSSFDLSIISNNKTKSELESINISSISDEKEENILNTRIISRLSVDKLSNYLSTNNCYANKYRLIIWKFLLNLSNFENIYQHYQEKGNNKEWINKLNNNIQINDIHIRYKQRLLKILSLLSNWCKLCEYINFLPSFIYPFIKLYKKNDIDCFECIMSILCKYCSEWFIDYPDPSINILSSWISILKYLDNSLYQHFKHHLINIEYNLWYIITNGFSSFFNEKDWLILWDHILTNPPIFIHLIPISIVLCCKNTLYSIHSKKDINIFFTHQQQLYIKNIIDKTYFILKHLPKPLIPIFKPIKNQINDNNEIKQYPIFNRYPVESLNAMQNKYEIQLENKRNDEHHKKLLKALESEYKEIEAKQTQFAQQQQIMDYSYKQRLSALQYEEKQNALKRKQKSDEMTQKRLDSIGNIQKTMKNMLKQQNTIKQLTVNDIENHLHHHKKISEIEHNRLMNATALNQLESDARNKLYSLQIEQSTKAQQLKLQRLKQQYDKEQKLKQQLLEETLSTKDNISNFKFIEQKNLLSTMNKLENEYDTKQIIKNKLKLESILNDNRQKQIESENEMTNLMNEQLNITQNMIEKQNKLQNVMEKQEDFEINIMTDQYNKFKENIKNKNENLLNKHKNELLTKLKQQQLKLNKLSKQQRLKHFKTILKEQQNNIKSDISNKDNQLQKTINLVKKQIEDLHEKQMELELREKEILEKNVFEEIAKNAETQIINKEKQKYANMREEMLKEMQKKEERLRERHQEIMNKLMKEREEQLVEIGQNAKNNVYHKEMNELEKEYEIKKKELKELKESYDNKQDEIREKLIETSNIENDPI